LIKKKKLRLSMTDWKFPDGFWCSPKLYACIKANAFPKHYSQPWKSKEVFSDVYIPHDEAVLIENGAVSQFFKIDWGYH
jgi:hypothetical protein